VVYRTLEAISVGAAGWHHRLFICVTYSYSGILSRRAMVQHSRAPMALAFNCPMARAPMDNAIASPGLPIELREILCRELGRFHILEQLEIQN